MNSGPLGAISKIIPIAVGILLICIYVRSLGIMDAAGADARDPFADSGLRIVNNRDTSGFKYGYEDFGRFDDIKASRTVSFSAEVPLQDLLKPGEEAPSSEMTEVFAKTRAIYYARGECERLMQTLARACEVDTATATVGSGAASISASLRFVQKAPLGDLDKDATWSFETVSTSFTRSGSASVASAQARRLAVYEKAVNECDTIRRREGDCAILSINIDGSSGGETSAQMQYGFLTRVAAH